MRCWSPAAPWFLNDALCRETRLRWTCHHQEQAAAMAAIDVYGPGEDDAIRFISNACCKALLGMAVTLRRDRLFSYVSVEDLAALLGRALDARPIGSRD